MLWCQNLARHDEGFTLNPNCTTLCFQRFIAERLAHHVANRAQVCFHANTHDRSSCISSWMKPDRPCQVWTPYGGFTLNTQPHSLPSQRIIAKRLTRHAADRAQVGALCSMTGHTGFEQLMKASFETVEPTSHCPESIIADLP